MQAHELREMTEEELRQRLRETRRELFNLRQQWYAGSLEDHNRLRVVRKDIARVNNKFSFGVDVVRTGCIIIHQKFFLNSDIDVFGCNETVVLKNDCVGRNIGYGSD